MRFEGRWIGPSPGGGAGGKGKEYSCLASGEGKRLVGLAGDGKFSPME